MKRSDAFPSNFIKSEDLNGGEVTLTITKVTQEELGDKDAIIIAFARTEKKLVCNQTNWDRIEALYGEDSDDWEGRRITLHAEPTTYMKKKVMGLRVKEEVPPERPLKTNGQAKPAAAPPPKPAPVAVMNNDDQDIDPNDDIPF